MENRVYLTRLAYTAFTLSLQFAQTDDENSAGVTVSVRYRRECYPEGRNPVKRKNKALCPIAGLQFS